MWTFKKGEWNTIITNIHCMDMENVILYQENQSNANLQCQVLNSPYSKYIYKYEECMNCTANGQAKSFKISIISS